MGVACCSEKCEKRHDCKMHWSNCVGVNHLEDYYSFGYAAVDNEPYYFCGKRGDYKMIESTEKENKIYIVVGYIYKQDDEDTWIEKIFEDKEQANACCEYLNIVNKEDDVTYYLSEYNGFCKEDYISKLNKILNKVIATFRIPVKNPNENMYTFSKEYALDKLKEMKTKYDVVDSEWVDGDLVVRCEVIL